MGDQVACAVAAAVGLLDVDHLPAPPATEVAEGAQRPIATLVTRPNSPEWMQAQPATTRVGESAEAALTAIRAHHTRHWSCL